MNQHADAATTARNNAYAHIDRIRANTDLSADRKRIEIAKVYTETNNTIRSHENNLEQDNGKRTQALERKYWGLPTTPTSSDLVAHRDANDRAQQLKGGSDAKSIDKATRALRTAQSSGDEVLAKAILAEAFNNGWGDVINAYLAGKGDDPGMQKELQELWDRRTGTHTGGTATFAFSPVQTPTELAKYGQAQIKQWAAMGDAPASVTINDQRTSTTSARI